jgi:hypothetical protein
MVVSKRSKKSKTSKRSRKSGSSKKQIAYCVRCRDKVKMISCKYSKTVKGVPICKGKCEHCGTKVNRFLKKDSKSC